MSEPARAHRGGEEEQKGCEDADHGGRAAEGTSPRTLRRHRLINGSFTASDAEQEALAFDSRHLDIELGLFRARMPEELTRPVMHHTSWLYCTVKKSGKDTFCLMTDTDQRVLLTAFRVEDHFFISAYSTFPSRFRDSSPHHVLAVVKRVDRARFQVLSTGCEYCDGVLGCSRCSQLTAEEATVPPFEGEAAGAGAGAAPSDGPGGASKGGKRMSLWRSKGGVNLDSVPQRQVLADVTQRSIYIPEADIHARQLRVTLPRVLASDQRCAWCPRVPTGAFKDMMRAGLKRPLGPPHITRTSASHRADQEDAELIAAAAADTATPDRWAMASVLPVWSAAMGSLVLKFIGSRIMLSSSKNFLFYLRGDDGRDRAVLQCGKAQSGCFRVDLRYPMSIVQAFGMFLVGFAWKLEEE